jgi:hypothetical protein
MKPAEYIPVFGGEIKMFIATPNTEYEEGQTIFSHVQYIDGNMTGNYSKLTVDYGIMVIYTGNGGCNVSTGAAYSSHPWCFWRSV